MNPKLRFASAAALAALALTARAAGVVEVNFVEPQRFIDAGRSSVDIERTTRALESHLKGYAAALPDGQTLRVDVLDVDLAGTLKPTPRGDLRVLRGGADWPHLTLRYALSEGDRTLRRGTETLTDLDYLREPLRPREEGDFAYEKRLLDRWFSDRIGAPQ